MLQSSRDTFIHIQYKLLLISKAARKRRNRYRGGKKNKVATLSRFIHDIIISSPDRSQKRLDNSLSRIGDNALVFSGADILQRTLEVTLWTLEAGIRLVLVGLQVGVDELDEAVEVLGCDGFVLLVEVVDVAVEDLDE